MDNLEMLKEHLEKNKVFSYQLPTIVNKLITSITGDLPFKMKMAIAISESVVFASQMRNNILLPDGTKVPTNAISFVLSGSGTNKDRTANTVRKCFQNGYDKINRKREEFAVSKAIQKAEIDGASDPETAYKKYYKHPKPLFASIGTQEGMIAYMNTLEEDELGAAYLYSGEIGSELQSNSTIVDNLRLLSEMYDLGKKEVKIIKSEESQSREIENLPFSALFIGSQENILYDESIKNKFKMEFTSKLARRSFFVFLKDDLKTMQFKSVDDLIKYRTSKDSEAIKATKELNMLAENIVDNFSLSDLKISDDAYKLFLVYMEYNNELSIQIDNLYPISKIVRKHAQWRALKLAGAFAILDNKKELDFEAYCQAIHYIEEIDQDMRDFENELTKEKYEVFADYMRFISKDNKSHISLHALKKMQFITSSGSAKSKTEQLVTMANSFTKDGLFTVTSDGVDFETIEKTDKVGASYKIMSGKTKQERAAKSADGFKYLVTDFSKLGILLRDDYSYLPFELKDGKRSNESIVNKTKWICLDVDNSDITDTEAMDMLGDYRFHIARTSNKDNPFKFRVILELDTFVEIKDIYWKKFIESISEELGIKVDLLPKSQVYFGYKGREVTSNLDGDVIETKQHIINAVQKQEPEKSYTKAQASGLLENKIETFWYLFEAEKGSRSITLIRACRHAFRLGASEDYIDELIREVNEYWIEPMDETRIEKTIKSQYHRWYLKNE